MTTGSRKTNDFCWINVMTPDADRAATFFTKLFGWTYGGGVPDGRLIQVDGHTAGALMDLAAPKMPKGVPPVIGVMVKVDDADAAVAKINALGGRAEPAFDVLENGRMAMCVDPNGAHFNVWQPKAKDGMDVDSHAHGAPTWFETLTTDVGRAAKFYSALFGWKAEERPMPGMTYTVFKLGADLVGGAMPITPQMGQIPPHWGTYFAVKNADETARLAVELGASQCIPATDIPGVGRFALFTSPQGVPFHVIQHRPS